MSSLGRIEVTAIDASGNAISGASVQIQRQGAQVSGSSSGNTITVDSPNAVVAGDTVALNTTTTPTRSVSSVTATSVVVGGPGFSSWSDDDRVSIVSTLPTIYEDPEGNTTKSNPLTTSSTGLAWCYATGGRYDVVITNGATVTMIQDFEAVGGESRTCNIYPSGSSTVYQYDTLRALAAGDTHTALKSATSTIFAVKGDGEIVAGAAGATHNLTGSLTVSAGITSTTTVASTTTMTAGTGLTATTGNVTATAGDFDGRRLKMDNGTALVDGDAAISAGWGNTATRTMGTGSTDTRGSLIVTCGGAGIAADPTVTITFKDGTYGANAYAIVSRGATNQVPEVAYDWSVETVSATSMQVRFIGTPSNTFVYTLKWAVIG